MFPRLQRADDDQTFRQDGEKERDVDVACQLTENRLQNIENKLASKQPLFHVLVKTKTKPKRKTQILQKKKNFFFLHLNKNEDRIPITHAGRAVDPRGVGVIRHAVSHVNVEPSGQKLCF